MPDYVTSPESQIMVLEVLSGSLQVILVIGMAIFSAEAVHSEIPVEIPWSEWGPKYACCFPHHPSHKISVFGSKMAYALPLDCTPEPGQRLEELPSEGSFYVHIWDFNRAIARSECPGNIHDRNSPGRLIRRPGRLGQSCFDKADGDLIVNHPYTTAVCPMETLNRQSLLWHLQSLVADERDFQRPWAARLMESPNAGCDGYPLNYRLHLSQASGRGGPRLLDGPTNPSTIEYTLFSFVFQLTLPTPPYIIVICSVHLSPCLLHIPFATLMLFFPPSQSFTCHWRRVITMTLVTELTSV
ncbi:hypothetical protein EDB19DRAFT_1718013 [Suillus lakei]|nr:hypothetical protein EDB19DRAFT_1718013 [Suillus lakei]